MQEVDLDHEGVKKVLLVEITRNIKNAQLTKWESKITWTFLSHCDFKLHWSD